MKLSGDPNSKTDRYGFFAFSIRGRGVFEGIFNVKPGGEAVVGVFWPDGRLNIGPVAGLLDLKADASGRGGGDLTFVKGKSVKGVEAR